MSKSVNKNEITKRIVELTHQKSQIEQELLSLQKQYCEKIKVEYEQYIGKCYKQDIEGVNDFETVYYKVLDFYDNNDENDFETVYYKDLDFYDNDFYDNNDETDSTYFWVLVVEDHFEDLDKPTLYIHKECADLLGHKEYFLRQLTPISNDEFKEAFDDVCKNIININIKENKEN